MTSFRDNTAASRFFEEENNSNSLSSSLTEQSRFARRELPQLQPSNVFGRNRHTPTMVPLNSPLPSAQAPLRVNVFRNGSASGRRCVLDRSETFDMNLAILAKKLGLYQFSNPILYTNQGLVVNAIGELIEGETVYFEPNGSQFKPAPFPGELNNSSTVTSVTSVSSQARRNSLTYDYQFKFVLVGDVAVGKSCLLKRFTDGDFTNDHVATICIDFGSKIVDVSGTAIKCQVWDTAGQEGFVSITKSFYREAAAALLVYDVTDPNGLDTIQEWLERVKAGVSTRDITYCLVANKIDLQERRCISKEQGEMFARTNQMLYFETSAKTGQSVEQVFQETTTTILRRIDMGVIDIDDPSNGIRRGEAETVTNASLHGGDNDAASTTVGSKQRINLSNTSGGSEGCCF